MEKSAEEEEEEEEEEEPRKCEQRVEEEAWTSSRCTATR